MTQQEKEKVFTEVTTMAKETKEPAPNKDALFAFLDEPSLGSNVPGSIRKLNKTIAKNIGRSMPDVPEGIEPAQMDGLGDMEALSDREVYTQSLDSAIENNAASRAINKLKEIAGRTAQANAPEKSAPEAPTKADGGMML